MLELTLDLTELNNLKRRLNRAENKHIQYGWVTKTLHKIKGSAIVVPTAQIAFWNEFGTFSKGSGTVRHIPPRPYLFNTSVTLGFVATESVAEYFKSVIYNNGTDNLVLHKLQGLIDNTFKGEVSSQREAPLSANTISKKGHGLHWVETGKLMKNFKVKTVNKKLT